jgi:hypothetical protein
MLKKPEDKESLLDWANDVVEDVKSSRRAHETKWWEQICVYSGDLWVEFNPHSRRLEEAAKPEHRVRLAINLASPVVRTEYAKLMKNRPVVDCVARSADKTDLEAAKVGDKLLNNYVEKQYQMPRVRRKALMWTLVTGLGAIFVDYDESAQGQVDVLMDPSGNPIFDPASIKAVQRQYRDKKRKPKTEAIPQGDLRIKPLGPMQWGWDLSTNDYEDAMWCYVAETYDVDQVYRRWGVEIDGGEKVTANPLEQRLINRVDLTNVVAAETMNPTAQDLIVVYRLFVKPGHRYFPDGAEIVFTESELIDATKFPWSHGQLPISCMGHIPMPSSRYPFSVISQIRDAVLEVSKTESQMIENRNLMANPMWVEYDYHQLADDAITNKPGGRIKVPFRPNGADPHPIEMPELPTYVQNLPDLLKTHVQEISGQGETSQGKVPAGARSGVAIAYLQEEDDTKLGPTVLEFEEMMERVAWQQLAIMAECFDVPRTVSIYRKHADPEVFDFIGTMLQGVTGVNVQAGSALPRSKAAKQQYILDLYQMGIEPDPRKVRDMLELGEGEPEEWELDMQQAERENDKMERGEAQKVLDWYNHQAHITTHRRFMKSADFEALPEPIQQIFFNHDVLHQRFLQGVDQAQQAGLTTPGQSTPQAQAANGANNQTANQGGPAAQNGQAPPSFMDTAPQ